MEPSSFNETLPELLCRPGNGSGSINGTGNGGTGNGSVCDLLRRGFRGPPAPTGLELWARLVLYGLIFGLSVVGNALVVGILALNRHLRTVTNLFLLSLALSDLLLALCCMPFTLLPNLMGTFVFGEGICKLMAYLMGVSVSVSTFSLVAIAIERHSAICHPLQARAWQTRSHACRVIGATWTFSLLLMLPYAIYSTTRAGPSRAVQCIHDWPSEEVRRGWYVLLLLLLFFLPGLVLSVSYGLISRELCRGLRFQMDLKGQSPALVAGEEDGDGCSLPAVAPGTGLELRGAGGGSGGERARVSSWHAQLAAKRRVIRMLVVIVALFFLCWLPIFAANTWKAFSPRAAQRALAGTPISFIHLLAYVSACANPLVYCFLNRRFRQALLAAAARASPCRPRARPCQPLPHHHPQELPAAPASSAWHSRGSCTTVSSLGPP
ncbi:gastrin/cholecystokinin type B receptor isoform X1 [Melanerpes formicivorus]|uniref:gastrin/cholecystokinin type B receptor isoform X1 n=1 Tax=Melanerpes formicivorus TaxID=211600 RepID=UPI00358E2656